MKSINCNSVALFVSVFLIHSIFYAQMYVGPNTFVYATNQLVFINQDLDLNTNSSTFYLRNDAQLLQGTTGIGTNKGLGNLSLFQEATANNFQYNYWCSPVGNTLTSTSVNNSFGIRQLGIPNTNTETIPATILASNIFDGTASPLKIASYWIYKFINKTTNSQWVQAGSTMTIAPGEGFTMKGSSGTNSTIVNGVQNNPDGFSQRYDFRGKPNDGTINIPVLADELTLTGNPYPSAINLQDFLISETNCTGIAYFWQHDKTVTTHFTPDYKGGYATYSGANIYVPAPFFQYDGSGYPITTVKSDATILEKKYAAMGQGFFVKGLAKGNVQMKNKYRTFVKEDLINISKNETSSIIRINSLIDNGPIIQNVLAFNPLATENIDRNMDASSINDTPSNVYFVLNNKEFVINSMPFDSDRKIPLGFKCLYQTNIKITVNEIANLPEVTIIYLFDKTTGKYHDIKNSFVELNLPAGTTNNRYEITFKNNTLGLDEIENKDFIIIQNNIEKTVTIQNPFQKEISSINIYDVAGKLIVNKSKLGNELSYTFPTSNLSSGVYIVKMDTVDTTEQGQKIIIQN